MSAAGDALLLFAVPLGLGLETKRLSSVVLMWLIPALAVYAASFLHRQVRRQGSPRRNYARLLVGVAILEIGASVAAFCTTKSVPLTILVSAFIFGYAFVKEGVPRLLYVVSVYNYFGDPKDYTRIAGLNSGLNILATLVGTLAAGWVLGKGTWRIALAIDALSFLFLAFALLYAGRDVAAARVPDSVEPNVEAELSPLQGRTFYWILLGVTLLPIANSLVWNYLPLLADHLEITSISSGIFMIAVLRLPGMLAGFRLPALTKFFALETCIKMVPIANLLASLGFIIFPSAVTFGLLVLIQGFVTGVYWPADYSTRNTIPTSQLVTFNTTALRRLAIFQTLSCICALAIFQLNLKLSTFIPMAIVGLAAISILSLRTRADKLK